MSITIVTPESEYLDSAIGRIREMGFDYTEKRSIVEEIKKLYLTINEVCIWQAQELHLTNISSDKFIQMS